MDRLAAARRQLTGESNRFAGELLLWALPPTYRRFRLGKEISFVDDVHGEIPVPEGAETDFASIPRPLWPLFPPCGRYAPAAVLHDHLYQRGHNGGDPITRAQADGVFLRAMKNLGVGASTRWSMWAAVRAFGWLAYAPTP